MINLQKQRFNPASNRPAAGKCKASVASSIKQKALKLSSAFLGLGMAATLGIASTASAVTLTDLPLPPTPGYRDANNNIQATSVTIDGDQVKIWYLDAADGTTEVCLELGNNVSWWKGVKFFGENNALLSFVARTGEARSRQCDSVSTAALSNGDGTARVEFWKAKGFGVHTHVDTLNFDPAEVEGKRIVFWWVSE